MKKARQNNKLEPGSDSIRTEQAPALPELHSPGNSDGAGGTMVDIHQGCLMLYYNICADPDRRVTVDAECLSA